MNAAEKKLILINARRSGKSLLCQDMQAIDWDDKMYVKLLPGGGCVEITEAEFIASKNKRQNA